MPPLLFCIRPVSSYISRVVTIGTKDSAFFAQKTDTVYSFFSIQFLQLTVLFLKTGFRNQISDISFQK